jgi:hypothetical protein
VYRTTYIARRGVHNDARCGTGMRGLLAPSAVRSGSCVGFGAFKALGCEVINEPRLGKNKVGCLVFGA